MRKKNNSQLDVGFANLDKCTEALNLLRDGESVLFSGLWKSAKAFLTANLYSQLKIPFVIVTRGVKEAEQFIEDLDLSLPGAAVEFPMWEVLPDSKTKPDPEISAQRLKTLYALCTDKKTPHLIVTSIGALLQKSVAPKELKNTAYTFKKGDTFKFNDFISTVFSLGYQRAEQVERLGEYSVRGGIIDIFSLAHEAPLRIEFWGDTIDTIRTFNPTTQLTEHPIDSFHILPADETKFYAANKVVPFMEYLPKSSVIVFDEPPELDKRISQHLPFIQQAPHYFSTRETIIRESERLTRIGLEVSGQSSEPFFKTPHHVMFGTTAPHFLDLITQEDKKISSVLDESLKEIDSLLDDGYTIVFSFNNIGEQQRFFEICTDKKYERLTRCKAVTSHLSGGFVFPETQFALISDQEIFGRYRVRRTSKKFRYAAPVREMVELSLGDLVVHANYGIGRYQGIQKINQNDTIKEMIVLEYAEKSKLFVPLMHSNLVRRYVGCGQDEAPKLDTLGTSSWQRKKKAAEEAVYDLAAEFLEIDAARSILPGYAFEKDNAWQREFEASFIYQETPDQLSAIDRIKDDMESTKPMDRLICGDVGYGKTEVAIRAAFKAVMSGKQVAMLVPTTVLAQQQYKVFTERMADYPVTIEMLSRFRTGAEQRQILKLAADGAIDILIGTHRLIQPDVKFRDLGLVIVDEEQRFGVKHKEQFKRLRRLIDVLTLTATPIPRTLYLSLVGARDMSLINTPPEDRLPVHTYVTSFDEKLVEQAIRRELNREGQVFFVHNRVNSIHKMKLKLQHLVPEAKIEVAHGQMHERELAGVMDMFRSGVIDILVCTTIIESGLDIPNANTIIIDRADRFGLADLYQLRGRVGRDKTRAYAYLLVPPNRVQSEQAHRRLDAIETHQELGAGYQIALRDLEIRGAGNILGDRQHGHITAVGFDMYCRLLKNAIAQVKGEPIPQPPQTVVKLGIEPEISPGYIPSDVQRMGIYSRLQDIVDIHDVDILHDELDDIYGTPPEDVQLLLDVVRIKLLAAEQDIDYVEIKDGKLILKRGEEYVTENGIKAYRVTDKSFIKKTDTVKSILKGLPPCVRISSHISTS
jgi:transcription-repair coupling factor (superfamily II helicase)